MRWPLVAVCCLMPIACDQDATVALLTPLPPAGLFTLPHSEGIALTWIDNSSNESSFEVEFARASGPYAIIATLPANSSTFTHTDIEPVLYHKYRVRACNAEGCSSYSNESGRQGTYRPAAPHVFALTVNTAVLTHAILTASLGTGAIETELSFQWRENGQNFDDAHRIDTRVEPHYDIEGFLNVASVGMSIAVTPGMVYQARVIAENSLGVDTSDVVTFTARSTP